MFDRNLKEAMELLGGRAVIEDGGQYYVILSLKEFRKTKKEGVEGLTKQELIDKINNDIASWKFAQEEDQLAQLELEGIEENMTEEVYYEKTV